jgi:hypothetical protein
MAILKLSARPSARPRSLPGVALLLAVGGWLLASEVFGQNRHYQLKAAFLVHFADYIDWPATAFPTDESPFVFGILGQNPFGGTLKTLVAGEAVKGRPAVVEEYASVRDITRCHVLFISDSERSRLPSILASLAGRSIVTVSDLENFTDEGGMIRFVTESRVRFRINVETARKANLTISSKLLRLADAVESTRAK